MNGSDGEVVAVTAPSAIQESAPNQVQDFLGFVVGDERYAVPILSVRELLRVPLVTEIPRGPQAVLGIISVRGHVTTLLDVHRLLGMPPAQISDEARVLLVREGKETFGLLVDRVLQVFRLAKEEIEVASGIGYEGAAHFIGIARPKLSRSARERRTGLVDEGEVVILLDPELLLRNRRGW